MTTDLEVRQTVRSAAEAGIEKPAGAPASIFELGEQSEPLDAFVCRVLADSDDAALRRDAAAAVCRSLIRQHGITLQDLEAA